MYKLTIKLDEILPKLCLDKLLLILRAITIFIWVIAMWFSFEIKLKIQLVFVAIIFISDALDGIYSRRFTTPRQQYLFRISDATVDKLGILAFLGTLFYFNRINGYCFFIIIGYNIMLVIFPIIYILGRSSKQIAKIQATIWSRIYAISVGLFCLTAIVSNCALQYSLIWALYFIVLGIVSFASHINKVKKLKGEN